MVIFYQLLLLLLLFPISATVLAIIILSRFLAAPSQKPLPPGPKPWPIVGNLPHLRKKLHISLQNLSNIYGPLISLLLGSQLLVVASSPAAAAGILKTHDRLLSARYIPRALPYDTVELDRKAIMWASDCNDNWKAFRAMLRDHITSAKALESRATVREEKVAEMVDFLGGKLLGESVDIGEVVFATIFDTLSNHIFSREFERSEMSNRVKSVTRRLVEAVNLGSRIEEASAYHFTEAAASPNLADFFPVLRSLDPQGLRRESTRRVDELYSVWQPYVRERRARRQQRREPAKPEVEDFLSVFLENGLDDDQIDWLILELFVAGTDSTTKAIEWAMAELIRNGGVMNRLREELKAALLPTNLPLRESEVTQLPYLNAIVKETLKLHPPGPLLLPHRAPEACEVMNYRIPKGAEIVVNAWAIARDPAVWGEDDPTSFKPERFIGSKVDLGERDFELLPFSAGRRMCPGVPLAAGQIPLVLAALVRSFDWCLPGGSDPAELDMSETVGITLQKERPLLLVSSRSSLSDF